MVFRAYKDLIMVGKMLIKDKFWQKKPQIRYYLGHNRMRQSLQNWVNIVNDILMLRDYTSTILKYTKMYDNIRFYKGKA